MADERELDNIKSAIVAEIEARRQELIELSRQLHDHPELGFAEVQASGWLSDYLERNGFLVEKGICQLPTAFKASYGQGTPTIAFLAEYDALPQIGHACGHNIIGVASVAAGVAGKRAVDRYGGKVVVFGTPAEEIYGGKIIMVDRNAFAGVDAALIVHPGVRNHTITEALACQALQIEFWGKPAHAAAAPHQGINALEAMLLAFNGINSLRQHIKSSARIHGIITDGGQATNVVPAHSAANFLVRARDIDYLEELKQKVLNCFLGAALATGARLEYKWDDRRYAAMRNNQALADVFTHNAEALGRQMGPVDPNSIGSTDMGNVSQVVPSIHPSLAIASPDITEHTVEFAAAAISQDGQRGLLDAAKALAMTAADLLSRPALMAKLKQEFAHGREK